MINGNQCATVWYVDIIKLSHMDPEIVPYIVEIMKRYFGDVIVH